MTSDRSSRRRVGFAGIVAALVLAVLAPGQVAAATRSITFRLHLGDVCLSGRASDNATVTYRWRDAAGNLKEAGQATANAAGYWYTACDTGSGHVLESGDRVRASDGNSTQTFVIPDLTLSLNRVRNVIKGTAPAGSRLRLEYFYPAVPVFDIALDSKRIRVGDDGHWRFDPGRDFIGGTGVFMKWSNERGDSVSHVAEAPLIGVTIGRARFFGIARAFSTATITVKDGVTREVKGSGSAASGLDGDFAGTIRDGGGNPLAISAGDFIKSNVAADAAFIVPDIEASGNAATEMVTGRCFDTGRFIDYAEVQVYRSGNLRGYNTFQTESDGSFAGDMTDAFPRSSVLKQGDDLLVRCMQRNGDWVQKWFTVP